MIDPKRHRSRARQKQREARLITNIESHHTELSEHIRRCAIEGKDSLLIFIEKSYGYVPCSFKKDRVGLPPQFLYTVLIDHKVPTVTPHPMILQEITKVFIHSQWFIHCCLVRIEHARPEKYRQLLRLFRSNARLNSQDIKDALADESFFNALSASIVKEELPHFLDSGLHDLENKGHFINRQKQEQKVWAMFFMVLLLRSTTSLRVYNRLVIGEKEEYVLDKRFQKSGELREWNWSRDARQHLDECTIQCNITSDSTEDQQFIFYPFGKTEDFQEWRGYLDDFGDGDSDLRLASPFSSRFEPKINHRWSDGACYFLEIVRALNICFSNVCVGICLEYFF